MNNLFLFRNEENLIGIRPLTQITCTCNVVFLMFIELACSSLLLQIKQTSKQIACVLHVKDFTYMEICITLKYTSLKQHPTPNPKREKKNKKRNTPSQNI
jgi:hypothetical protein